MSKLSIWNRLKIVGIIMMGTTGLLVAVAYSMVTRMSAAATEVYNRGVVGSKLLAEANNAVWELRFGIANYTLANGENRKKILDGRPQHYATLEENLKQYAQLNSGREQDPVLKDLLDAYSQYKSAAPKWFELIDAQKLEEAADYRAKVTNVAGGAMVRNIKVLIEKQFKTNEELEKGAAAEAEQANSIIFAIGAIALVLVFSLIFLLARAIAQPLRRMQAEIEAIERDKDFTRRIAVTGEDEIGVTAAAFNKLMGTIQESLRQLLDHVDQVSTAARDLLASSTRVTSGSAQQNEATASIARTVEQVTSRVSSVSENTRHAVKMARESGELSNSGGEVIEKTIAEVLQIAETMKQTAEIITELGRQSDRISTVVQVIRDVADQTNLLALNAAIEAARAGEQGRGFAVVADEVRKLAERTTNSTAEISQMIGAVQQISTRAVTGMSDAVARVDAGVALVKQAGDAITQIRDRAAEAVNTIEGIASTLREQTLASNDIAAHIGNVARVTDANSSAIGEIDSAIHHLERLSEEMRGVGQRFRI